MESQPKNPEFRNNPENFHQLHWIISHENITKSFPTIQKVIY